jgi:hypothetical protein
MYGQYNLSVMEIMEFPPFLSADTGINAYSLILIILGSFSDNKPSPVLLGGEFWFSVG